MARSYRKDYLTKDGNIYYVQFHIADWMRNLPAFRNLPETRVKFKKSLGTSNIHQAHILKQNLLRKLGVISTDATPLPQGRDAYYQSLARASSLSTEEIVNWDDDLRSLQHDSLEDELLGGGVKIQDPELFDYASASLEGLKHAQLERIDPLFNEPHPYKITLREAHRRREEEHRSYGSSSKLYSTMKMAVSRFLIFINKDDFAIEDITPSLVHKYVNHSRKEKRNETAFRNDIQYLSQITNVAIREGFTQKGYINPFTRIFVNTKGFEKGIKRKPFTDEMLEALWHFASDNDEMRHLILISYYTGARISEIFGARVVEKQNHLCFSLAEGGGKTESATRCVPLHDELLSNDELLNWMGTEQALPWHSTTHDALGKKFGRFKDQALTNIVEAEESKSYVHHSFRHLIITNLLNAGINELDVSNITGHKRKNMGRTEAAKTYYDESVPVTFLKEIIDVVPKLIV